MCLSLALVQPPPGATTVFSFLWELDKRLLLATWATYGSGHRKDSKVTARVPGAVH